MLPPYCVNFLLEPEMPVNQLVRNRIRRNLSGFPIREDRQMAHFAFVCSCAILVVIETTKSVLKPAAPPCSHA